MSSPTDPAAGHRPLSDEDYRTLARFRHALRVFQRFSEDAARSAGMTPNQHQLLLAIRGWGGQHPPAIADLAEVLQLRPHSTAELVHRAVAAGLVHTTSDPADHRRQLSTLTSRGEQLLASLTLQHRDEIKRFRSRMNDLLDDLG